MNGFRTSSLFRYIAISQNSFINMSENKEITAADVAKHNTESDCWIIIGNAKTGGEKVYDVSKYLDEHPGGAEVIMEFAGGNADTMFEDIGHSKDARTKMAEFLIGNLKSDGSAKSAAKAAPATKSKQELESKGGLSPVAIIVFIIAILLGVYFSQQK
jgi:cytochrome b involved in lipid metabolism